MQPSWLVTGTWSYSASDAFGIGAKPVLPLLRAPNQLKARPSFGGEGLSAENPGQGEPCIFALGSAAFFFFFFLLQMWRGCLNGVLSEGVRAIQWN